LSGETTRAQQAGMSDVLSKPLQLLALSQKLEQWLPEQMATASGVEHLTGTGVANGTATHAELRQLFTTISLSDLQDLLACAARSDAPAAAQVLHRLLGALPLFDEGDLLEQGRQLFETLQSEGGEQAIPELAGFAQRMEQLLSRLARA
jgi:hypothetical protein